jgi:hypothetical protein
MTCGGVLSSTYHTALSRQQQPRPAFYQADFVHACAMAEHVRSDQCFELTRMRPSAASFWLNRPISVAEWCPCLLDRPSGSSGLGLSFSEPLAEQAKGALDALWRFAWASPGALHVSSRALYYTAVPTTGPLSLEHGNRGPEWALRLPPSTGASFWGSP